MNNKKYESPRVSFNELNTFESVAAECWATPNKYTLVDPTVSEGQTNVYFSLSGFKPSQSGCNGTTIAEIQKYLYTTYPEITESDALKITSSGGGNDGQPLKASKYIIVNS